MRKMWIGATAVAFLLLEMAPVVAGAGKTDLVLTKHDSADSVRSGQAFDYELDVSNVGKAAQSVALLDPLPSQVSFDHVMATDGTCSYQVSTHRVTCALSSLDQGASFEVKITVIPQTDQDVTISNTATVSSSKRDQNPADNSDTEMTLVKGPRADMTVVNTDTPDPAPVGKEFTYTVTVRNNGPDAAINASAVDNLPSGVTFNEATSSVGSCSQSAGIVTCSLGDLAAEALVTITIKVTPQSVGTIKNLVTVSSDTEDPQQANNADTESTEVAPFGADLKVKATGPTNATEGATNLVYVFDVFNIGPETAVDMQFDIILSPGLTLTALDSAGSNAPGITPGNCAAFSFDPQHIHCQVSQFEPDIHFIHLELTVTANGAGSQTLTAEATTLTFDPHVSDNSKVVTTEVA